MRRFIYAPKSLAVCWGCPEVAQPRLIENPITLDQVEQVHCAKLLGICFTDTLQFEDHLVNMLKICSWRTYLLKPLQVQGLLQSYLNIVFRAMVQGKITYATPAWCGFLTVEQIGRINAFLKQAYKYAFCSEIFSFSDFADDADITLFSSMLMIQQCLNSTLPNVKTRTLHLQCEGKMHLRFTCVLWTYTKALFFPRCLYKFVLFRFILLVAFCSSAYFV